MAKSPDRKDAGGVVSLEVVRQEEESWREAPLVPSGSIAGRALVTIVAIMTFLAALTAGLALFMNDAAQNWRASVAQELTVQIKPVTERNIDADVERTAAYLRAFPGVGGVRVYSRAESERLLEPWLGAGQDLSELPVPRLIAFQRAAVGTDIEKLRKGLMEIGTNIYLDDHGQWLRRLSMMAQVVVAGAIGVFLLVMLALALAVVFATRGAMAGNQEIIVILHYVGADDAYISRQFQKHFLRLGLQGGVIGAFGCFCLFMFLSLIVRQWATSPGGSQMEALFGGFSIGWSATLGLMLLAAGVSLLTGHMSKSIVFRHLRQLS